MNEFFIVFRGNAGSVKNLIEYLTQQKDWINWRKVHDEKYMSGYLSIYLSPIVFFSLFLFLGHFLCTNLFLFFFSHPEYIYFSLSCLQSIYDYVFLLISLLLFYFLSTVYFSLYFPCLFIMLFFSHSLFVYLIPSHSLAQTIPLFVYLFHFFSPICSSLSSPVNSSLCFSFLSIRLCATLLSYIIIFFSPQVCSYFWLSPSVYSSICFSPSLYSSISISPL